MSSLAGQPSHFRAAILELEHFDRLKQERIAKELRNQVSVFKTEATSPSSGKAWAGAVIVKPEPESMQRLYNTCNYSEFKRIRGTVDGVVYDVIGIKTTDDMDNIFTALREKAKARTVPLIAGLAAAAEAIATAAEMEAETISKIKEISRQAILGTIYGMATYSMRYLPYNRAGSVPAAEDHDAIYNTFIPEVIVGTVPLYAIQNIEGGMSDLKIKYRAIGDVFLAHQQGSGRTLRIDGKFYGPLRYVYLHVLLALQKAGEGVKNSIDNLTQHEGLAEQGSSTIELSKEAEYEHHATIPVITQTEITLDLYIQTLEWNQTIETGGERCVNYTILFRRYVEPDAIQVFNTNQKKFITYGTSLSGRLRQEALLDVMWKASKIATEVVRVEWFDGKYTNQLNREAIYTDPYVSSMQSLTNGAMSEMYDLVVEGGNTK